MAEPVPGMLEGRRCLVTGGGTGIGRGIALCLADHGATVTVTGRRRALLEETVDRVRKEGATCHLVVMDVTQRDSVAAGIAEAVKAMGGFDVLVNNAGAGGPNACALDGPERWDEIVRTNLDGTFFCCREAAPYLADGGRIVNVSSVLGRFGVPGYTAYCASKHGVLGLTKALAMELAPRNITVNAVCPGWVETDMARQGMELLAEQAGVTYEEARADALGQVPLGRILQPGEIGELIAWLCSEKASGMTGQGLVHDGGQVMW